MDQKLTLKKLTELLSEEEPRFAIIPMEEYENLLMQSEPEFRAAFEESEKDIRENNLTPLNEVLAEFGSKDN